MISFLRLYFGGSLFIKDKNVDTTSYDDKKVERIKETNDDRLDEETLVRNLIAYGNDCFASGKYKKALETYFAAIQTINPAIKFEDTGKGPPWLRLLFQYSTFNTSSIQTTKQTFHMVKVLVNISAVLLKTDKVNGAIRILQETLKLSRLLVETFGVSHPMNMGQRIFRNSDDDLMYLQFLNLYADTLQNMGLVYNKRINYESAQDKLAQSITYRRSALKLIQERKSQVSDHDDIRSSRFALAKTLQIYGWTCDQRGLFDESKHSYCEALNLSYDDEEKSLIPLLTALAESYVKCREFHDAQYSFELIMEMIKQDKESASLIHVKARLSSVQQKQGKNVEALQLAQQAFLSAANLTCEDEMQKSIALSEAMSNLGALYFQRGNYAWAKKWYKLSLEERLQHLKLEDPLIMESIDAIARVYSSRKNFLRLIVIYTKCIEKFIQVFGENHRCVATLSVKLGEAYSNLGNHEVAIQFHYDARRRMSIALAGVENHPTVACILRSTAVTYCMAGRMDEGFDTFAEALEIFHKCGYANSHPDVADTLQNIDAFFAERR